MNIKNYPGAKLHRKIRGTWVEISVNDLSPIEKFFLTRSLRQAIVVYGFAFVALGLVVGSWIYSFL